MAVSDTIVPTLAKIEAAAQAVYFELAPTPQYRWALRTERLGADCWVKHEKHTRLGALKTRGGLTYFDALARCSRGPTWTPVRCAMYYNNGSYLRLPGKRWRHN